MEKILDLTKKLGEELQKSQLYKNYELAKENADSDAELQSLIKSFNDLKENINSIMMDKDSDKTGLDDMNKNLRELYEEAMGKPNMIAFNNAKEDLDKLMIKINNILTTALNGGDPNNEVQSTESGGCSSGGCSSCSCGH